MHYAYGILHPAAEESIVITSDTDVLTVDQDTELFIDGHITINKLNSSDNVVTITLNDDSSLKLGSYSGTEPLKGNIAIKYLDEGIMKSPRFDSVEQYYIPYGGKAFPEEKISIKEWYEELNQSIKDAQKYPEETQASQSWVPGSASKIYYTYDYGDEWKFVIAPMNDIKYLLKDKRVT